MRKIIKKLSATLLALSLIVTMSVVSVSADASDLWSWNIHYIPGAPSGASNQYANAYLVYCRHGYTAAAGSIDNNVTITQAGVYKASLSPNLKSTNVFYSNRLNSTIFLVGATSTSSSCNASGHVCIA